MSEFFDIVANVRIIWCSCRIFKYWCVRDTSVSVAVSV